ncbi:hypothetical protein GCM10023214_09020 [Amycolatopsis dongchuanensis]|uniref:Uncharacterized protein n=3 Tax=Pseudonocardiaceae TaxID=2070 RepID=A0A1I3X4R7_9PSEU|nr:hypothetical protein SAMN05421835_114154 [Amycolatopsis sacchari]
MGQPTIQEVTNWDLSPLLAAADVSVPVQSRGDDPVPGQASLTLLDGKQAMTQDGQLSEGQKLDLDESGLLCELATRAEVDPVEKPLEWYKKYVGKLVDLGYKTDNFGGNTYREDKTEFKLSEVAFKILVSLLGGPAGAAAQAAIDQLRQYDKEGMSGPNLFSSVHKEVKKHSFSIGHARLNRDGLPEVALAFFSVEVDRAIKDILVASLRTQTTRLFAHSTTLHLTRSYDDETRKIVRDMIKQYRSGIQKWKLKPSK